MAKLRHRAPEQFDRMPSVNAMTCALDTLGTAAKSKLEKGPCYKVRGMFFKNRKHRFFDDVRRRRE